MEGHEVAVGRLDRRDEPGGDPQTFWLCSYSLEFTPDILFVWQIGRKTVYSDWILNLDLFCIVETFSTYEILPLGRESTTLCR